MRCSCGSIALSCHHHLETKSQLGDASKTLGCDAIYRQPRAKMHAQLLRLSELDPIDIQFSVYKDDGFICSLGTALFGCLCISLGPLDIDIPTHACKRAACGTLSRASIKYNWRNF
jgi:hypothetical protein